MILAIDIGNSQTEIGVFQKDQLYRSWRISSTGERTEDEYWIFLERYLQQAKISLRKISGVGLASVVPNKTFIFQKMCQKYLDIDPIIVTHELNLGIKILYHDPATVGGDRICNAVAAFHEFRQAVIVVDIGTATTFDVVNGKGEYLGGIISPGVETTAWALYHRAAKLPKISLEFPDSVVGRTTEQSMQSGIMWGTVKIVEGLIEDIRKEIGENCRVIATGGLGKLIQAKTKNIESYHPHLVLEGLYKIYQMNS